MAFRLSGRDPAAAVGLRVGGIWHPAETRREVTKDEIIEHVLALIDTSNPAEGRHIYSVKVLDMLGHHLDAEPVMRGSRLGQIFHSDLYSEDRETVRRALDQLVKQSGGLAIGLCTEGHTSFTWLVLTDSERKA